jgi:DNA polymerase-1
MAPHTVIGPDWGQWDHLMAKPLEEEILGLDTEFTGLDYWSPDWRLKLVQVYTSKNVFLYDVSVPAQEAAAREILETCPRFISHGEADCLSVWRHFGIDITERNRDTHTLASLLWPHKAAQRDLKTLVAQYLGPQLDELEEALHARFRDILNKRPDYKLTKKMIGEGFARIPTDDPAYRQYAAGDAYYVKHLFCVLEPKMYEMNVHKAWERECQIRAMATRMQMRGMLIHTPSVQSLTQEWGGRLSAARKEWEEKYDCVAGSPKRSDVLIASGVKLTERTKPSMKFPEGNWTLTAKVMEDLIEKYPENEPLKLLKEVSDNWNVATFLTGLAEFVDENGVVHPSINTLGAETGRWTEKEPAVQTVGEVCRSVFIPHPGNVIVSFDLGQIEPRVAVALSGERNLIPALLDGLDVYDAGALQAFGPKYTPKQRKHVKRVVLGSMFSAGVDTLVHQAKYLDGWDDVTPKAIRGVQNLWREAAPSLDEWGKELQSLPRIDLESGRYVPKDHAKDYRAINSSCQGNARDALMLRAVEISKRYDGYILHTMHDEILLDVPLKELHEVVAFVKPIMEQGFLGIPTPVDIEVFPKHWAGAGVPYEEFVPF